MLNYIPAALSVQKAAISLVHHRGAVEHSRCCTRSSTCERMAVRNAETGGVTMAATAVLLSDC
jgi:hypothetical protein